ncbi:hypothetical protein Salat_2569500 [Sesamum alatum]|uniref:CCHC-type domain-containing protein n=1 Tax=Sesamum alatum TaxID=300844 RepID=A0AAE2CCT7_9LAMI|nr:hypothetical protein Salat_2569500 [Sesamum alatum]
MWSRHAFDERLKNDHVTNNISESFNHWVGDLRSKPVLTLVDGLRTKLMSKLQKRKLKGLKTNGDIVPNAVKELNKIKEESRKCHLLVVGEHEFEVQDQNINYIVNLRSGTCNCRIWNVSGIPLPDPTFWPQELKVEPTNLLPPIIRRMLGRPKKNRRKEPSEAPNAVRRSNMVRCKICNDHGHNKRTCPVSKHKGKDLELDVPLARLASRKRKAKGSLSQHVAPTRANKKTKSQSVPKPPISSSQPLPNTEHGPAASSSQPSSNLGASYLPPSFWRGLGVSPQMEIRSKKNQDNKAFNPDACKQQ